MIKRYGTRNGIYKAMVYFLTFILLFGLAMPIYNTAMAAKSDVASGELDESGDLSELKIGNNENINGLAEYFPAVPESPITLPSSYFKNGIANLTSTVFVDTIEVNKTAKRTKDSDGNLTGCRTFEVTLEITGTPQAAPVDVVLILDRSGSMNETTAIYKKITTAPSTNNSYYVKVNGEYQKVDYHEGIFGSNKGWRYSIGWNTYRYVKWDNNGDDNAAGSSDSDNPVAKPFYEDTTRLYHAKEAAINFASKVLGPDGIPGSRVSVVSYSGPKTVNDNGNQNQATTDVGLTDNLTSVVNAINGLNAVGGTNTQAGFLQGKTVIDASGNPTSNKVVIMFTDGLPTASNGNKYEETTSQNHIHVTSAIAAGKSIFGVADVFTIGLLQNMTNNEKNLAKYILNQTQNKGFYEAPTAEDLNAIFTEISQKLAYSATNAEVIDKIGANFNLIESSLPEGATYNTTTHEITWKPGTIVEKSELKYKIQAKPEFEGGTADTNEYAKLTYTDIFGAAGKQKDFPKPQVEVPTKLAVSLTDATILLGDSITLGTGVDPDGENYMSSITGGDGNGSYTYEWRIKGSSTVISTKKNPKLTPTDTTTYELTVTDSNGCKASAEMEVTVLIRVDVIIEKKVTGNYGDLSKGFEFTLLVNGDANNPTTFTLSNGESKTIESLPSDAVLTLTEESSGYDLTVTASGINGNIEANNGVYTINVDKLNSDRTITFTNHKEIIIDTGITLDSLPYIIILAAVIAGITILLIRKRKSSINSDE